MNKYSNNLIKKVIWVLPFCLFTFLPLPVHAQKYIDHLQQQKAGQGKVTVTQSPEITELVNGKPKPVEAPKPVQQDNVQQKPVPQNNVAQTNKPDSATQPAKPEADDSIPEKREEPKKRKVIGYENYNITTEDGTTIVDKRKKVMSNATKVSGYRIQAFAGGNTRADRVKAEQAGNKLKNTFPDQPVYVHFYSPRWICRMGNYKTYNEAAKLLKQVRKLGYPQACIVKGKITVQY